MFNIVQNCLLALNDICVIDQNPVDKTIYKQNWVIHLPSINEKKDQKLDNQIEPKLNLK